MNSSRSNPDLAATAGFPAERRRSRGRAINMLRLALTLLAIGLVAWIVDWARFVDLMRHADPGFLVLAVVLFAADRLLMSYKWKLLLDVQRSRVSLLECWGLYSLATLVGTLMPATVGGDVMRIAWLWRRGVPTGLSTASIALERLTGSVVALGTAVLALAYLSAHLAERTELEGVFWVALGGLAVALAAAVLSFWAGIVKPLALLPGRLGRKVAAWLTAAHQSYVAYLSHPGVVVAFVLLTIVEYVLIVAATYVVALVLNIQVGPLYFAAALSLALLVARLPIAIDGLGVFEGSMIGLLLLVGIQPADSVALAITSRLLNLLACAPPATLLLSLTPGGLNAIWKLREP